LGNNLNRITLTVVHAGRAQKNGNRSARRSDIAEHFVYGNIFPACRGKDIKVG
jgi:hypothetical protein